MKSILLTGGTGYIGSYVLPKLLQLNYKVHLVGRTKPTKTLEKYPSVNFIEYDLLGNFDFTELMEATKPSHLMHLAWTTEHGKFWNDTVNKKWLESSLELIKAFSKAGGQHIVAAGTCAEYEWGKLDYLDEGSPLKPASLYGQSKKDLFEQVLILNLPLNFAWGRIFFLYGPGENKKRLIPYVINEISEGRRPQLKSAQLFRDFIYVDDVAEAFVKLSECEFNGPCNIASGEKNKICDIANVVASVFNQTDIDYCRQNERFEGQPYSVMAKIDQLKQMYTPRINLELGIKKTLNS